MATTESVAPQALELRAGELRLALRPDLGGCLAGLWLGDLPVLLSAEPLSMTSSRPSASYPLVPYSNRIGYGHFRWHGHDVRTRPNFSGNSHSVHGVGWQRPWQVEEATDSLVRLSLHHSADADWPFAFSCEQRISLGAEVLRLEMSITNTDTRSQPAGLGWHPYFSNPTPAPSCPRGVWPRAASTATLPTWPLTIVLKVGQERPASATKSCHCD
jgi:aldose 1-epimerase